ncbi:MAG: choice-of-anchor I family protein [Verrucomicrobia bacterium]|nr:choice-of-anchor I family protein [Verrucomicrobiota bacterium]
MKLRLKLVYLIITAAGVFSHSNRLSAASFTQGNIAVLQAEASANNTTASVIELGPNAAGQTPSNIIPIDGTTAPNSMRFSGSATSTGYLTNSADGSLLVFTGGNTTTSGATNINTILPRAVGTFNAAGTFNLAATYTGVSGNQARSATSLNNTTWFIADQGGMFSNGTSTASPSGNVRSAKAFGGVVYVFSGSTTLGSVSTIAAATGSSFVTLPGIALAIAANQDFYLISSGDNGAAMDVLYVLTATSNTAGIINKFSLVSGTWTANGSYTTSFGGFGLAAKDSGAGAELFVSSGQGALTANSVIKVTDTAGYNTAINIVTANNITLYTAPTGKIVKGVAFAPFAAVTPIITGTATAAAFTTTYGTASAVVQTFPVTGSNLSANITATAPAGFEVSTDGTTFAGTASFASSSGSVNGTLSVRLSANAAVLGNLNSQNIALTSAGATTVNITTAASGNSVSAKALTVTANDVSKNLNVTLTGGSGSTAFTSSGLANSETVGSVTITYGAGGAAADPAGTYATSVVASLATGGSFTSSNYAITYMAGTITVNPAVSVSISGLTADNKAYDRTTSATLSGTPALVGVLPADVGNVTLSGTPVATFASAGFGNGIAVTVTGYTLSGSAAGSYALSQPTGLTANITQLALTVSGAAVTPKPFDGNTNATITGMLTGVIAPDVVTFNGSGNFVSSAIGTGIAVTSTSTIGGANAGNYVLTQLTGLTGDITAPTVTSVDLSNYIRVGRHNLPEYRRTALPVGTPVSNLLCDEASGVAYNWDTDTLFICGDGGRAITQVTKTGQLVNTMTLELNASKPQGTEFYDPEGITYIGGGQFVFSEERERQLVKFTYVAGTTLTRAAAQTVDLGTFDDNTGTEGLSWDPQTNGFIVLKEKTPIGVFQTGVDFALGTATNGSPTTANSTNLFNTTLLGMTDVADVFALSNVPSMTGQPQAGNLLILGQENARVVNVDRAGNIVSTLNITSDVGNPLSAADQQHEGITMDRSGNIYIVNENGGGSIEFPQLWVYAPSTVPNQAPTALVINNAVNSIQENTSTLSPIKVGDLIVTDDGLGVNTFSLSGADAASFQITNASLFIKPGVVLDFETKASYAVTINVDDTTVGTTPDATLNYTLTVTDQIVEIPLPPALIVTEVAPWSSSNSPGILADWFEVTNVSAAAVDITDWRVDDANPTFATAIALSGITSIAPGESVIFLESSGTNPAATVVANFRSVWFGASPPVGLQVGTYQGSGIGLSTSGDAVNLFTAAGTLHSGVTFGAADAATPFQTFDNTAAANNTAISLLSQVGVNGAFVAANSTAEIGSPGFSAPGVLRVTEVAPWSSGNSPVAADWFEVTNTGARAVDITGWKVDDSSESPIAALPLTGITSIAPGESVIFIETPTLSTTKTTFLSNWFGASPPATLQVGAYTGASIGLSTGGDAVNLYDTNNVRQANVSFAISPSAAPFTTFDNAAALNVAALTQFSVAGVNGAFIATNSANEIGSPGARTSAPIGSSTVSIAAASIAEGNSGTTILNLPVTRTNTASVFTVNYAVTGGTATSGTDFTLAAGTLSFTFNGAASQNIAITINGDTTIESNETITVTLSGIVNANGTTTLGTAAASGTITNDDTVPVSFPATARITASVKGFIDLDAAPLSSTNGAEIPAFDPVSKRAFTSSNAGIQVINLTNPAAPAFITTIVPASLGVAGLTSNDVSSITVRKASGANPSVLAAGIISSPKSALGYVIFLNPATGALLGSTVVGANPDHIAFSPDGTKLLVANEGELDALNAAPTVIASDTTVGSVSIISVPAAITGVPTSLPTTTADFTSYDSQASALSAAGVRIFQGGKPSTDFEPEYFAISADSTKAMVTLQEANAVATLDIATATFTSVVPLGKKNFSTGRHDFSDADGAGGARLINPTAGNPVYGLYMPDAVASYSASGQTYYITANEGDDRNDWLNPDETILLSNAAYDLDDTVFPNELALKANAALGKLTVCNSPGLRGDTNGDGDIDEILSYGGRSFSILDSAGAIIWDSGDMIENIVASQFPANFDDGRSDNKGPEPEGVTIATLGARTYAFIGLERSHMTLMFDVTNPAAVTFAGGLVRSGDLNPEGLVVVSAADSPTGKPLLLQASEVSQTLTVFELNQTTDYTLQVLHYYGESGLLGIQTAPIMGAMIDRFDDQYSNTIVVGEGDSFIPGPWLIAGADPVFNNLLHTTSPVNSGTAGALGSASTFTAAADRHQCRR